MGVQNSVWGFEANGCAPRQPSDFIFYKCQKLSNCILANVFKENKQKLASLGVELCLFCSFKEMRITFIHKDDHQLSFWGSSTFLRLAAAKISAPSKISFNKAEDLCQWRIHPQKCSLTPEAFPSNDLWLKKPKLIIIKFVFFSESDSNGSAARTAIWLHILQAQKVLKRMRFKKCSFLTNVHRY